MITQSTPLYAVGIGDSGVDLMLVVGWKVATDEEALPLVVFLKSSDDTAPRVATLPAVGGDIAAMWHQELTYFDIRSDACGAYDAALAPDAEDPA